MFLLLSVKFNEILLVDENSNLCAAIQHFNYYCKSCSFAVTIRDLLKMCHFV